MRLLRSLLLLAALAMTVVSLRPAFPDEPLKVVATFSILGDTVKEIGGAHVTVTTLVGPDGDAHVYQPTPADARAIADAKIVFVNGLGFEGWMDRLLEATGYKGPVVRASHGVTPLEMAEEADHEDEHDVQHHEGTDPHAWQDLGNGQIYAANIANGLAAADPDHAGAYRARGEAYGKTLAALDAEVRQTLSTVPEAARKIITSHDAFQYFGHAYGVSFIAPVGINTEDEPSAGEIAALIKQIREQGIKAVFVENIADRRLMDQIARETGATVGGTLYSDALSAADGPAASYVAMFRHNAGTLGGALTGK